ncbi:hypothetical protein SK128_002732 [Halocaridina rubra]|uniref:Uncharacterized protein n=1 Tax=Halocaridina rubra TaxID=373956 RepID=A0AAN8WPQ5_HALRR
MNDSTHLLTSHPTLVSGPAYSPKSRTQPTGMPPSQQVSPTRPILQSILDTEATTITASNDISHFFQQSRVYEIEVQSRVHETEVQSRVHEIEVQSRVHEIEVQSRVH